MKLETRPSPILVSAEPTDGMEPPGHADLETPAIQASGLRKAYKKVQAVDEISFSVASGEIMGLLGPNGAGKTTTIEMILGLRRPDAGSVRICGLKVSASNREVKALIGAQLQRTEFPGVWTVFEVLDLFATFYPRPMHVDELLDRFGLVEKRHALVRTLSGGQLRRLGLAVALVGRPRVLCLDEPTSGLDAHARRTLWDLIADLRRTGLTLLLTTHSMEEAEQLCDRVAIIDQGRILELDAPRRLVQRYFPERAIQFESAHALDPSVLEALPGVTRVQMEPPGTFALFTSDPVPTLSALLQWADAETRTLLNIQIRTATLEDVFLQMTGRRIHS
jgi:ABC-2 type transport system ATP-binding protein